MPKGDLMISGSLGADNKLLRLQGQFDSTIIDSFNANPYIDSFICGPIWDGVDLFFSGDVSGVGYELSKIAGDPFGTTLTNLGALPPDYIGGFETYGEDTLVTGYLLSKIYLVAGRITSTVITSISVTSVWDVTFDGTDVIYCDQTAKIFKLEGCLTSTVLDSIAAYDGIAYGVSWDGDTVVCAGQTSNILWSQDFTTALFDSVSLTGLVDSVLGVCTWEWQERLPYVIPSTNNVTAISGTDGKLHALYGQFTSEIITSIQIDAGVSGLDWDGENVYISNETTNILSKMFGMFSTTILDSVSVTAPTSVSVDGTDTIYSDADGIYKLEGFTSVIKDYIPKVELYDTEFAGITSTRDDSLYVVGKDHINHVRDWGVVVTPAPLHLSVIKYTLPNATGSFAYSDIRLFNIDFAYESGLASTGLYYYDSYDTYSELTIAQLNEFINHVTNPTHNTVVLADMQWYDYNNYSNAIVRLASKDASGNILKVYSVIGTAKTDSIAGKLRTNVNPAGTGLPFVPPVDHNRDFAYNITVESIFYTSEREAYETAEIYTALPALDLTLLALDRMVYWYTEPHEVYYVTQHTPPSGYRLTGIAIDSNILLAGQRIIDDQQKLFLKFPTFSSVVLSSLAVTAIQPDVTGIATGYLDRFHIVNRTVESNIEFTNAGDEGLQRPEILWAGLNSKVYRLKGTAPFTILDSITYSSITTGMAWDGETLSRIDASGKIERREIPFSSVVIDSFAWSGGESSSPKAISLDGDDAWVANSHASYPKIKRLQGQFSSTIIDSFSNTGTLALEATVDELIAATVGFIKSFNYTTKAEELSFTAPGSTEICGAAFDGSNTLWIDKLGKKLYVQLGKLTTTVLDSISTNTISSGLLTSALASLSNQRRITRRYTLESDIQFSSNSVETYNITVHSLFGFASNIGDSYLQDLSITVESELEFTHEYYNNTRRIAEDSGDGCEIQFDHEIRKSESAIPIYITVTTSLDFDTNDAKLDTRDYSGDNSVTFGHANECQVLSIVAFNEIGFNQSYTYAVPRRFTVQNELEFNSEGLNRVKYITVTSEVDMLHDSYQDPGYTLVDGADDISFSHSLRLIKTQAIQLESDIRFFDQSRGVSDGTSIYVIPSDIVAELSNDVSFASPLVLGEALEDSSIEFTQELQHSISKVFTNSVSFIGSIEVNKILNITLESDVAFTNRGLGFLSGKYQQVYHPWGVLES